MRNRFRSSQDGMNRRKPVWICLSCHGETEIRYERCDICCGELQYFPSMAEARRYKSLLLELQFGQICDLTVQPSFPIVLNGKKVTTYRADFRYIRDGQVVVEDVKGLETDVFKLKKKLVEAVYGIKITVVKR